MKEVERIVLVHKGAPPNGTELNEIVSAVAAMGFRVEGAQLTARGGGSGGGDLTEKLAQFVLLNMEDEGLLQANSLDRATIHVIATGADAAVLAIVAKAGSAATPTSQGPVTTGDQRRSRRLFGKRG